jgi:hypothetical protein
MKSTFRGIGSAFVVTAAVGALLAPGQATAQGPGAPPAAQGQAGQARPGQQQPVSTSGSAPTVADQDMVVGAWVLDPAKSTFSPGPAPAAETRTYQFEHEGLRARIVTSFSDGQQSSVEYVASYNDVVALVTGSKEVDAIQMRKIDARTAESTLTLGGKVVGTAKRVISPDGKTMTITVRRDQPTPLNNVSVYTKQ